MDDLAAILGALEHLASDRDSRVRLEARWQVAGDALPGLALSLERFVRAWDRMLTGRTQLAVALETAFFEDVVLAIACREGDPAALALFDQRFLAEIPTYLGRNGTSATFADEVRQSVRWRLFVAAPGASPKIASYAGTGPLGAWLRVVTIRCARDLHRAARPEAPLSEAIGVRSPEPDPELDYLKMRYGQEFRAALAEVLVDLEPRQRNLLKLYFLDGLTVEVLGGLFGVNRSTITRRLAEIRERIRLETHRLLNERLGVGDAELERLWGLVESRIELSLRSLLVTKR